MNKSINLWPYGILAFFALLFCGIVSVVVIAVTHSESMVSEKYYDQEMAFQTQIDSANRAKNSGASISRDSTNGNIVVTLPASQLAQKFSGTIELYRPSDSRLDQELQLAPAANGTQMLDVSKLATGPWQVRAKWNAGGQSYFLQERIVVARK
jgi:hypothetical protein